MEIHSMQPFAIGDKNFGAACNRAVAMINEDDWIILTDYDFMFLLPEHRADLYEYAAKFPDSLLTCYTNRVGNKMQCLGGVCSENADVRQWVQRAKKQRTVGIRVKEHDGVISGYMLMFSKKLWNNVSHFQDDKKILGVDNGFAGRVLNKGYKIYIMESIVGFHIYRILDRTDKRHLK